MEVAYDQDIDPGDHPARKSDRARISAEDRRAHRAVEILVIVGIDLCQKHPVKLSSGKPLPRFRLAEPFERLKLRMVNGSHSALAYLGAMAGLPTVDRAIADPTLRHFVDSMLRDEVAPTLPPLPGLDLERWRAAFTESGIDAESIAERAKTLSHTRNALDKAALSSQVALFSSKSGEGVEETRALLDGWLQNKKPPEKGN